MNNPDYIAPVSSMADVESRLGIPSIESLLAERDDLVKECAPLRAKHGPFGTYDALRKVELSTIASALRAQAVADGRKMTEAGIDEAAHADDRYIAFITLATQEKAEWAIIENSIQGINDTILRANAVARYLAGEVMLAR